MIVESSRPPKVAICKVCRGRGLVAGDDPGEEVVCTQCEGSGRVTVSCRMTLDVRAYKPRKHNQ